MSLCKPVHTAGVSMASLWNACNRMTVVCALSTYTLSQFPYQLSLNFAFSKGMVARYAGFHSGFSSREEGSKSNDKEGGGQ